MAQAGSAGQVEGLSGITEPGQEARCDWSRVTAYMRGFSKTSMQ